MKLKQMFILLLAISTVLSLLRKKKGLKSISTKTEFNSLLLDNWGYVLDIAKVYSYNTDEEIKKAQKKKKIPSNVKFIESKENESQNSRFVVFEITSENSNTIVISFRGTEFNSWSNWKNNADDTPKKIDICNGKKQHLVHAGFHRSFDSLSSNLLSILNRYQNLNDKDIVFTGHSLGGAMSTLAYIFADCNLNKEVKSISLITLGSPRVLTKNDSSISEIAAKRNGFIANVQISGDIVASVPLSSDGYAHFTPLVIFNYEEEGLDDGTTSLFEAWWYNFKNGLKILNATVNPLSFIAQEALKLTFSDMLMPEKGKIFKGYFSYKDDIPDMKTNVAEIYYDHSIPTKKFTFRIRLHTWYQNIDRKNFTDHLKHSIEMMKKNNN